jgi:hypothetical protein
LSITIEAAMSSWWNYRVGYKGSDWGIYEVYWEDGRITGVSVNSVVPTCESRSDLLEMMKVLQKACEEEPLDIDDLSRGDSSARRK